MTIQTISFTTLGYRGLDGLGDVVTPDELTGVPRSTAVNDVNLYAILGDGDTALEAGETAHKLGDTTLLGRVQNAAASITVEDPVTVTAHGRINKKSIGTLTDALTFRSGAFGIDDGPDGILRAGFLNSGDSVTYATKAPLASVDFTVDLRAGFTTKGRLLLDIDGDVMRTTGDAASGAVNPGKEKPHFLLALNGLDDGDKISIDFVANKILVNGVVAKAAVASAASVNAFFAVFDASDGKKLTLGSIDGRPIALEAVKIAVDTPPANTPIGPVTDGNAALDSLVEGAAAGTAVGITLLATDPDAGNSVSWSLSDARFVRDAAGVVRVASGAIFDFETASLVTLVATATSSDGSSSTKSFPIAVTDRNEFAVSPISDNNATADRVEENAAAGTLVGLTARATDGDGTTNTVTYALGNDAGGRFVIDAATGVVSVADGPALDFESNPSHVVTVVATSADGSTSSESFTIGVIDIGGEFAIGPVGDGDNTPNTIAEDAVPGTAVGILLHAVDPDAEDAVSFALDDPRFEVGPGGVVRVAADAEFDFETEPSITVVATATSSDGSTSTQSFVIAVGNVNEATVGAVSDGDAAANTIAENADAGTAVGLTLQATDADPEDTVSFALDDDRFEVGPGGVVRVGDGAAFDFETEPSITVVATATSSDGSTSTQSFVIAVGNVNEATVGAVSDGDAAANTIAENADAGTAVGLTLQATDADPEDTVSFALDDDRFEVGPGGVVRVGDGAAFDFETEPSITVVATATSSDGSTSTQSFTIGLGNVNEAAVGPVSDGDAAANTIAENAGAGTAVGLTLQATDADPEDSVSFALDDDRFEVGPGGVVRVADGASFDFETEPSITLFATATSSDGSTSTQSFTLAVGNVNEAAVGPVSDTDAAANQLAENVAAGAAVGLTLQASDADPEDTVSFALDDGRFTVDANGVVRVANGAQFDFETEPSITLVATATSSDGSTSTQSFAVTVTDVDEFNVGAISDEDPAMDGVAENAGSGTTVGITAAASDGDGTTNGIAYSLDDDAGGRFAIDATTGVARVVDGSLLDFGTDQSHTITVRATSEDGSFATADFNIPVTDVGENTAPVANPDTNSGDPVVEAGVASGDASSAGDVLANDEDPGDSLTVAGVAAGSQSGPLSGTVGVAVEGGYGSLTLAEDGSWTYALDNALADALSAGEVAEDVFSYTARDAGGLTSTSSLTIGITGANDAPTNMAISEDEVPENIPAAVVGTLRVDDPDAGDTVAYSILQGGDGALFTIVGNELRVGATALDFEADPTLSVTVRATDSEGDFLDQTFAIDVLNSSEGSLTTGADTILPSDADTQLIGTGQTLTPNDNLDGGGGFDSLVLFGLGTFNLNALAGFANFEEVRLVNLAATGASLTLRDGSATNVVASGIGQNGIALQDNTAVSSIQGADGGDSVTLSGSAIAGSISLGSGFDTVTLTNSATAGSISLGNDNDSVNINSAGAWDGSITIDGGGGTSDFLRFQAANATFDLRSATLSGIEQLTASQTNTVVLIDDAALTGVTALSGSTTGRFVTEDAALNLSGKSVSSVVVESANATGTTFTVNSKSTAFQVRGGAGDDTITATGLTFTADELDFIFNTSIETVTDAAGTHAAPAPDPNTFALTTGADAPTLTAADETVTGTVQTLTPNDNLDGAGGFDVLELTGPGTFNLNALAGFANFEEVRLVNLAATGASLTLRDGSATNVVASGIGQNGIALQGNTAVSSIQGADGGDSVTLSGSAIAGSISLGSGFDTVTLTNSATAGSISLGNDNDSVNINSAGAWDGSITIDGGGGTSDFLRFQAANATFDLRSATLSGIEQLTASQTNTVVLIDDAALTGVTALSGSTTGRFVTEDAALNLSGKSVSSVVVESANATGTTFTVNSKSTAFQVRGGAGDDTITATGLTFTADELDFIFNTSIETVTDAAGTHAAPAPDPNTFALTTGADAPTLTAADETVTGTAQTLTPNDNLDGAGGFDVLELTGPGTFNLNALAGFANFEEVRLVNLAATGASLTLRDGSATNVVASGIGQNGIALQGNTAVSSIQGADGGDSVTLSGSAIAGSISLGSGFDTVTLTNSATAGSISLGNDNDSVNINSAGAWDGSITIDGGGGTSDFLRFQAANATFDLRSATLSGIEQLTASQTNTVVLIDDAALTGVTALSGSTTGRFVTEDAALNLSGKSVSSVVVESANATGTTFTVNSKSTAFQVRGGAGDDTITATGLTFTADELDFIFNTSSIETITDTSGTYTNDLFGV